MGFNLGDHLGAGGKFLRAADWPEGRESEVEIERVELVQIQENEPDKPVLYFKGHDKGLVLNKTNAAVLIDAFGEDTDQLLGKRVVIYRVKVQYAGQLVPGLRLRVPASQNGGPEDIPF